MAKNKDQEFVEFVVNIYFREMRFWMFLRKLRIKIFQEDLYYLKPVHICFKFIYEKS